MRWKAQQAADWRGVGVPPPTPAADDAAKAVHEEAAADAERAAAAAAADATKAVDEEAAADAERAEEAAALVDAFPVVDPAHVARALREWRRGQGGWGDSLCVLSFPFAHFATFVPVSIPQTSKASRCSQ